MRLSTEERDAVIESLPYEDRVEIAKKLYGAGLTAFSVEYGTGVDRKDFHPSLCGS